MVKAGVFMGENISRFDRTPPESVWQTPLNWLCMFELTFIKRL